MTDVELLRQLARMMGWEIYHGRVCGPRPDYGGDAVYEEADGTFWRMDGNITVPWRPLHDLNDAMGVAGKMRENGYDYEIGSCLYQDESGTPAEGHSAMFMRGVYDLYDDTWDETHEAVALNPARAICLAALGTQEKEE